VKRALSQAFLFASIGLALLGAFELLTFELPRTPLSSEWKNRAVLHIAFLLCVFGTAFVGSIIGFWLIPANRALRRRSVITLGGVFALIAYLGLAPTVDSLGILVAAASLLILAAAFSFVGGYAFSRNAA
jgi:hypothetical protein